MTLITLMPWGDAVYVRRARNQKWGVNGNEVGIVYVRGVRVELWEVYVVFVLVWCLLGGGGSS